MAIKYGLFREVGALKVPLLVEDITPALQEAFVTLLPWTARKKKHRIRIEQALVAVEASMHARSLSV